MEISNGKEKKQPSAVRKRFPKGGIVNVMWDQNAKVGFNNITLEHVIFKGIVMTIVMGF